MTRIAAAAAAAVATLITSGAALADQTYYGTSDRMPISQEQNNASLQEAAPRNNRGDRDDTTFTSQTFGYIEGARGALSGSSGSSQGAVSANENGFVGTAWLGHANADASVR